MCGRFSLRVEMDELLAYYRLVQPELELTPRYNIAPGLMIPAIIEAHNERKLGYLRWGLVPSWAKDDKVGYMMINARADSLTAKPAFRKLISSKRCIIPADGYYEWRKADKQPFRITMESRSLFSMAALYDTWVAPSGEKLSTCTIITTEANEGIRPIHERMPAIIPPDHIDAWLSRDQSNPSELLPLLKPTEGMFAYPVSPIVGNARNDSPAYIEPYNLPPDRHDSMVQIELF